MQSLYDRVALALGELSRTYLCDEDPDERHTRLREEALVEIDATLLPILQLRWLAVQYGSAA